ncbi:UDP-N-acetylmuramate dehydrogenase [Opitutaceae bacterium]|nr:UDP-N-acetylmuramate dehydrogenase [Opitutaceae bacterium]
MTDGSLPQLFGQTVNHIHAIGVGGMGLGPLAMYLADRGWRVTGEEAALSERMAEQLVRAGVGISRSGASSMGVDLVVYSSAVPSTHPTRVWAEQNGVKQVRRGELLAEVARGMRVVGVAGSHGKTTVTAMLISILRAGDFPVSYVLGGLFADSKIASAAANQGDWLVIEIDESDGTIDLFEPEITVLVNLDWDHADRYAESRAIESTFADLVARTKEAVLSWTDCRVSERVVAEAETEATKKTFGREGEFRGERGDGELLQLGGAFDDANVSLSMRGDFNTYNAVAALAAAQLMGAKKISEGLAGFMGVHRRQGILFQNSDLTVMEDYAHHPTEIRCLLASLRAEISAGGRLVVVFQPHRFSRTRQFKAELADALSQADSLHLLDVYGAGESSLADGTTGELVAVLEKKAPTKSINYVPDQTDHVMNLLRQSWQVGDLVVFVGAGDIEKVARGWVGGVEDDIQRSREWDAVAADLRSKLTTETKVVREEPLATKTTMRVGGAARVYVEPVDLADLQVVLAETAQRELAPVILGRGSNLLVPDGGVNGVVISLRRTAWETFDVLPDGRVRVGAGLRLKNLCGLAAKAGLVGFEFLEGIPGNVGGALRMNAGAMGGWMIDVVDEVELLTYAGERRRHPKSELHYGYRHCTELKDTIAVSAVLKPRAVSESEKVGRQIDVYRSKRQESQPREPSAGCIFKNPEGDSAGRLIEVCGLKGERVGDAEVSPVHGNFIVNRGQAKSEEVVTLVRRVRGRVKAQTGIELEPEVLLYGAQWEELL